MAGLAHQPQRRLAPALLKGRDRRLDVRRRRPQRERRAARRRHLRRARARAGGRLPQPRERAGQRRLEAAARRGRLGREPESLALGDRLGGGTRLGERRRRRVGPAREHQPRERGAPPPLVGQARRRCISAKAEPPTRSQGRGVRAGVKRLRIGCRRCCRCRCSVAGPRALEGGGDVGRAQPCFGPRFCRGHDLAHRRRSSGLVKGALRHLLQAGKGGGALADQRRELVLERSSGRGGGDKRGVAAAGARRLERQGGAVARGAARVDERGRLRPDTSSSSLVKGRAQRGICL